MALVLGRVGADIYPLQERTPLEAVRTFERFVGGFAGNTSTGLARLGVPTAIVSAVGDDGHGRFVRAFLEAEGVDCRWLSVHPTLPTALAFAELWPPDHFPVLHYRFPTCPDWELTAEALPLEALREAPLVYATGVGLAREPSRTATLAALESRARALARVRAERPSTRSLTIVDLDWRPAMWERAADFPPLARRAVAWADVVLGGISEFDAAGLDPHDVLRLGATVCVVKRGPDGATLIERDGLVHVPGLPVPVTNGLGAGDAFAAAFGAALLAGLQPREAARRGNAAGAIVATRLACSAAMPTAGEVHALLAGAGGTDTSLRT